ncbi:peptidoglycan DD-metalloendopeptidase family protein [Acinetobacter wanghuae]|uniref:Peptidoglycan DD-metalloendopeptidase family protein n=1 Tax=Acinetobacter wanghuae TaxID=2662362 RepID=A0A5Q0P207_9GAMM|nr:peptidoglycan DD-metalloendopeptidase family protein [Acinetobacter wanghuae]MQW93245.1 peptidoglycan DD-metalloendopeptidase family protein [Acinetobacter wanghuae]QGA10756.1 peptidoglycan DD-metalloendopeptidase family protein [Acinetobacter wanghuae]
MVLVSAKRKFTSPATLMKAIAISSVVASTVLVTGCASKPLINGSTRYAAAPDFYTVRSGDTLSGIATRYGLNYVTVAQMNDIAEPYRIFVGQSIRLKNNSNSRNTTTQAIAQAAPIQRQTIALPSNTTASAPVTPAKVTTPTVAKAVTPAPVVAATGLRWVKPSQGSILQSYNLSAGVKGTRYTGKDGDPVYAAADGQVVYAADGLKEYGNLVLIKHINGYITAYAHNSKMNVKSGENVTAGQKIAEMGSTGTTRTMLEFQVRLDGKPINPANVLANN